jgi:hypothetical protein
MNGMNIISPLTAQRQSITMPSNFFDDKNTNAANNDRTRVLSSTKPFSEYMLFVVLENQRNKELREIYKRRLSNPRNDCDTNENFVHDGVILQKAPPRYQNLHLTSDWFISKLTSKTRPLPSKACEQAWKSLDQHTKLFLSDTAAILRDRYQENLEEVTTSTSTPSLINLRSTITPPSSPIPTFEEAVMTLTKMASPPPPAPMQINEVDMSDLEIKSMWEERD